MAVDLGDLIEVLQREVNPPGGNVFPDATEDNYLGYLQDAFWEAILDGFLVLQTWTESEGIITPVTEGDDDIPRDLQQLVVLYAGIRITRVQLTNLQTLFSAQAGPVKYETQQSATLLKAILDELKMRRDIILTRLSDLGTVPDYYIDALIEREYSIDYNVTHWFR